MLRLHCVNLRDSKGFKQIKPANINFIYIMHCNKLCYIRHHIHFDLILTLMQQRTCSVFLCATLYQLFFQCCHYQQQQREQIRVTCNQHANQVFQCLENSVDRAQLPQYNVAMNAMLFGAKFDQKFCVFFHFSFVKSLSAFHFAF